MPQRDQYLETLQGISPYRGMGESAVLRSTTPWNRIDISPIARGLRRQEKKEAARQQSNEDFFKTMKKNLPEYWRKYEDAAEKKKQKLFEKARKIKQQGGNLETSSELQKALQDYKDFAKGTKQLQNRVTDIIKMGEDKLGEYTNIPGYKGRVLKAIDIASEQGEVDIPEELFNPDNPEHFKEGEFLSDFVESLGEQKIEAEKVTEGKLGQYVEGETWTVKEGLENLKVSYDKNGVPIVEGDVSGQVINDALKQDDRFNRVMTNYAETRQENEARKLMQNPDSRYYKTDMGINEVIDDAIQRGIMKPKNVMKKERTGEMIRKYMKQSYQKSIKSGHGYPSSFFGDGDDTEEKVMARKEAIFRVQNRLNTGLLEESEDVRKAERNPDGTIELTLDDGTKDIIDTREASELHKINKYLNERPGAIEVTDEDLKQTAAYTPPKGFKRRTYDEGSEQQFIDSIIKEGDSENVKKLEGMTMNIDGQPVNISRAEINEDNEVVLKYKNRIGEEKTEYIDLDSDKEKGDFDKKLRQAIRQSSLKKRFFVDEPYYQQEADRGSTEEGKQEADEEYTEGTGGAY